MVVLLGIGGAIFTEDNRWTESPDFPFLSISVKDKELQKVEKI